MRIKMLCDKKTVKYGFLYNFGVYEIDDLDALPMIKNSRCLEVNEKPLISKEKLIEKGDQETTRRLRSQIKRKEKRIDGTTTSQEQAEASKDASLKKLKTQLSKVKRDK